MDLGESKSKLLGTKAVEIPVLVTTGTGSFATEYLTVFFKSISPRLFTEMMDEVEELKRARLAQIATAAENPDEEQSPTKIPNEITYLLNKTVVSLKWKTDATAMRPGVDFDWDEVDDRTRKDIWMAIEDYTYPKSNA